MPAKTPTPTDPTPAQPAAAPDEYKPAVFLPPADKPENELVDSEQGKPWHLAYRDADLRAKIQAGDVQPMTAGAFQARASQTPAPAPDSANP